MNKIFDPNSFDNKYGPETDYTTLNHNLCECSYFSLEELDSMNFSENLNFNIIFFNIRSLPKNLVLLDAEISFSSFHVLGFTETRLSECVENLYKLPTYDMFASSRNNRGVGSSYIVESTSKHLL